VTEEEALQGFDLEPSDVQELHASAARHQPALMV
jgi:hypothetical protein